MVAYEQDQIAALEAKEDARAVAECEAAQQRQDEAQRQQLIAEGVLPPDDTDEAVEAARADQRQRAGYVNEEHRPELSAQDEADALKQRR